MIKKIAVTGTKGKSSTLRMLQSGFMALDYNVYGTYGIDGYFYNGNMVRPGISCEDYLIWDKKEYPTDIHLIEATSFTLDSELNIFENFEVDYAVFTSFDGSEHSEIHKEEGSYLSAKRKIFSLLSEKGKAVVCRDIKDYSKIIEGFEDRVVSYGFHPESDYVLKVNLINEQKMIFNMSFGDNSLFFKSKVLGEFNAQNMAAAYIVSQLMEMDTVKFFRGLESFGGFPGRLERYYIPETNNKVIIDYAHTQDSLCELLKLTKKLYPSRKVITIFGCGGNKSKEKRPLMGKVSDQLSSFVVLTNDNPRQENPADIIHEIISGITDKEKVRVVLDRSQAIKSSLSGITDSVLVIAGKGNEHEIAIGNNLLFHRDSDCLTEWCYQNNYTLVSMNEGTTL